MRWRLFIGGLAGLLAMAGIAMAATSGTSGVTLCIGKKSGAVSLAKNGKCAKSERKSPVAQQGPAGARGPAGAQGATGPAGAPLDLSTESPRLVGAATGNCAANVGTMCGIPGASGTWESYVPPSPPASYLRDAAGWVHLSGGLRAGNGSESQFEDTTTMFYLPPGYRPSDAIHRFYTTGGSCSTPGFISYVDIYPNGAVKPAGAAVNSCYRLNSVVFHP